MYKRTLVFSTALLLSGMAIGSANAQVTTTTTKTEVIQNADGSYSVIEYPVGKEVVVNLLPSGTVVSSKGVARVMRAADGTKVVVDLTGVQGDMSNVYAYAVDPSGATTLLGPVTINAGTGRAEFTTPLNQFMVVLSPNEGLTTYDPTTTTYVYRSEVPKGYAIVPRRITSSGGTKSVATAETVGSTYDVPLLGVSKWNNKTNEVRIKFGGELQGLDGKAYLKRQGPKTQIKMRFGDMRKVPQNKRLVLWASPGDGTYTKIGQVVNTGGRDESEIRGEVALTDFGLFMTAEDVDVTTPTSRIYSTFTVPVRR